ncbi:MAG TPA: hypothetical protein VN861_03010 [Candidatus Acidoferrales bacterium]|nr:hypothetical protein [Candidatus Acidoferrales bacterium]
MKRTLAVVLMLIGLGGLAGSAGAGERGSRYVLNYKRLSTREIGISCANSGDPTGVKVGDTLVISCGK